GCDLLALARHRQLGPPRFVEAVPVLASSLAHVLARLQAPHPDIRLVGVRAALMEGLFRLPVLAERDRAVRLAEMHPHDLEQEGAVLVVVVAGRRLLFPDCLMGEYGSLAAVRLWHVAADCFKPRDGLGTLEPLLALDQVEHAAAGLVLVVEPDAAFLVDRERPF